MGFRINTNIAAMNALRNATNTNMGLDKSLASLSSGLRINTAADDASGMTIADSLRSQAQGLGQAINNANDGVAVVQTADGALDEYVNIINTVRTKSIQAASDGQNADSRAAIQADIDRLLEAADGIANQTQFNGQKLLDGTFTNKAFQIGAYAGETVNLSVNSVQVDNVGDIKSISGATTRDALVVGTNILEGSAGYSMKSGELKINDIDIASQINTLTPRSMTDAANIATAITAATGLISDAENVLTAGSAVTAGSIDALNYLKINGIAIGDTTVLAGDSDGALVRAINNITDQTGVTASFDTGTQRLKLESADGSNISINSQGDLDSDTLTVAAVGVNSGSETWTISDGTTTLTYNIGSSESIASQVDGIIAMINASDVFESTATTVSGSTTTLDLTGKTTGAITYTEGGTAGATDITQAANADINGTKDISGLSADNLTNLDGTGAVATLAAAQTESITLATGELVINGVDLAGTYGDNATADTQRSTLQAAIQAIDGMSGSTITSAGLIKLIVDNGDDLNIAGTIATGTYKLTEGVTNESKIGSVNIYSENSVKISGGDVANFGFTVGTKAVANNGSSLNSIDVNSRSSAAKAILIADSALKQIDATRADLGSVQNQLESTIRNISVTQVNVSAAESQIRDVDFAQESANFAKLNILAQSGSYAMSQANAVQQNVMRLLQ